MRTAPQAVLAPAVLAVLFGSAAACPAHADSPQPDKEPHPRVVVEPGKKSRGRASKEVIQIKLVEGSADRVEGRLPVTQDNILARLAKSGMVKKLRPLVPVDRASLVRLKRQGEKRTGKQQADLSLWLTARVNAKYLDAVLEQLNQDPTIEVATAMPLPVKAPGAGAAAVRPAALVGTPSFVSRQGYSAHSSVYGIGAQSARTLAGGRGEYVAIADLEYDWDPQHEDLTRLARSDAWIGTLQKWEGADPNHGTGVMGVLVGDEDTGGVTGLVPKATPYMVPTITQEAGYNVGAAVALAAQKLTPGDVLLLEQQTAGCGSGEGNYVPAEWDPAVHDAVSVAVAQGIHVVEAGGNGGQDLDEACYGGAAFPAGRGDSGAIIVGAGASPQGGQPAGTRLPFSTYGSRVNLHGWGEDVTTTGGAGELHDGGVHRTYTGTFNGTSSAAPIVAGAVAQVSSVAEAKGRRITPEQMRATLVATGTTGASGQGIGLLPSVPKALATLGLNGTPTPTALANGDFELGSRGWTGRTSAISSYGYLASSGLYKVSLGGYGRAFSESIATTLTVPTSGATLIYDRRIVTRETGWSTRDRMYVQLVDSTGSVVATLATHSNTEASSSYATRQVSLAPYAGRTLTLRLTSVEDSLNATTFLVDNFRVQG